jgi:hypothetical protein
MMDEMELREVVRQGVRSGCLPATASTRTFPCSGNGSACAVCAAAITGGELAFELEFGRPTPPFVAFYQLHPRCYAAWQLERQL